MRIARRLLCSLACSLAAATAYPLAAHAEPNLALCLRTEGAEGEQSDCPSPGASAIERSYESSWVDPGPELAIARDAAAATWSAVRAESSIFARYGAAATAGFANDYNAADAYLDADDFVITGPAGAVSFTLNVFVAGVLVAASDDAPHLAPDAAANATGTIFTPLVPSGCSMAIAGGVIGASGVALYGLWAEEPGGTGIYTSGSCSVNTGQAFRIRLVASTSVGLATPFELELPAPNTEASARARVVLGLPPRGVVFNLPAGYSAASPTAKVIDNVYVPEAGAVPAALVALGALAARRRVYGRGE